MREVSRMSEVSHHLADDRQKKWSQFQHIMARKTTIHILSTTTTDLEFTLNGC